MGLCEDRFQNDEEKERKKEEEDERKAKENKEQSLIRKYWREWRKLRAYRDQYTPLGANGHDDENGRYALTERVWVKFYKQADELETKVHELATSAELEYSSRCRADELMRDVIGFILEDKKRVKGILFNEFLNAHNLDTGLHDKVWGEELNDEFVL